MKSNWLCKRVIRSLEFLKCTNVTQYYLQTEQGGLFVEYINKFLKLKSEAIGYPDWVGNPEEKNRYIDNFYASEGIRLDKEAIKLNAAKRGLA